MRPLILVLLGWALQSAQDPLARYVFDEPAASHRLSNRLTEISGLATTPDGRLFAHDDERAVIYEVDHRTGDLVKGFSLGERPFRDDFEGIAVAEERFYLVSSTGRIYESGEGEDDERLLFNMYETGAGRMCEIEGLEFDPDRRELLLACKRMRESGIEDAVVLIRWSIDSRSIESGPLIIPLEAVELATDQRGFATSGIARDPVTGVYVLVSAQDRALVSVSPSGDVLGGARLDRDVHRQAEGIAFTTDGALWIADEAGNGRARLTGYAPVP